MCCASVVGGDAGQIERQVQFLMQIVKETISPPQDIESSSARSVKAQAPEITNADRLPIDKPLLDRNASERNNPPIPGCDDRMVLWAFDRGRFEEAGLALKRQSDPSRHRAFTQQLPDR